MSQHPGPSDAPPGGHGAAAAGIPGGPPAPGAEPAAGMYPPYLLGLRLAGRRVVVIGGGTVAARRVPVLAAAGAQVAVISPQIQPGLAALAAAGLITWQRRGYARGDCAGAWLVSACTSSPATNAAVAAEADALRIWCVRADDGAASAAWTPASGQAAGVQVAVLSGDPRRSAGVRDAIIGGLASGAIAGAQGSPPAEPEKSG